MTPEFEHVSVYDFDLLSASQLPAVLAALFRHLEVELYADPRNSHWFEVRKAEPK